ncbi:MAG: hypothetical protein IKT98_10540 [Selenomonadaceae bacterium]|nr:hypothetical protein [Selenomonadaceae bacterium]
MIQIKVDNASALAGLNSINPAQIRNRLKTAVQRTLEQSKSKAATFVNQRFTRDMTQGKIKVKASGLSGSLSATDKRHSLSLFPHNPASRINPQPAGGVTAYVRKGVAENHPRAFIGRGQVFERIGRPRLPLMRYLGAGAANELGSSHVAPKLERFIGQRIEQEMGHLI